MKRKSKNKTWEEYKDHNYSPSSLKCWRKYFPFESKLVAVHVFGEGSDWHGGIDDGSHSDLSMTVGLSPRPRTGEGFMAGLDEKYRLGKLFPKARW